MKRVWWLMLVILAVVACGSGAGESSPPIAGDLSSANTGDVSMLTFDVHKAPG